MNAKYANEPYVSHLQAIRVHFADFQRHTDAQPSPKDEKLLDRSTEEFCNSDFQSCVHCRIKRAVMVPLQLTVAVDQE
jgi:hypothetical protein